MHTTAWSNMPPSPLSVQSQLIWRWTDAGSKRIAIVKLQRCDSLTPLLDILHLAAKAHASNQARLGWRFMAGEGDSHAGGWWLVFVMCQSASKQGVHRLSQSWSVLVSEPQAQSLATLTSGVRELRCQSDQASNVCAPGWLRSGECPTSERQPPSPFLSNIHLKKGCQVTATCIDMLYSILLPSFSRYDWQGGKMCTQKIPIH